jgi:hypothetical protein
MPALAESDPLKRADESYVAVFGDVLISPDDKHDPMWSRSTGVDARFGWRGAGVWGYEVRGFYGKLALEDARLDGGNRSGLGVDAICRFGLFAGMHGYLLAGVGAAYSDSLPGADWIAPYANVGVGLSTGSLIELWERPLRVRAEVRYAYEDYRDEYRDQYDYDRSNYLDLHALFGIEFALTRRVAEAPPAPPQVVPIEDTDGDGVADAQDQCPDTGPATVVDAGGCPR